MSKINAFLEKGKNKTIVAESSDVDESQVGDVFSEVKILIFFVLPSIAIICDYTSVSLMYRMMITKARMTP